MTAAWTVPIFAELYAPSLVGFPVLGLVLWLVFLLTAAAGVGAAKWMHREHGRYGIPQMEWWTLIIGAAVGGLIIGVMQVGLILLPLAAVAIIVVVFLFTKQRDKRVPPNERLLTKDGLKNLRQMISANRDLAAAEKAAKPAKPFKERLKDLFQKLQQASGKKKKKAPTTGGTSFTLLKKDGTIAIDQEENEEAYSENVANMRKVLIGAMHLNATDVHLDPSDKEYIVRLRVDGVLQDSRHLSQDEGRGVVSALKVVSDMDISERRRPQDGGFAAILDTVKYDVRSASTPTSYGEKMVLRLLNSSGGVMSAGLSNIGLRTQILDPLREVIHKPYGMFLVTGPTGSGKTTTCYASLSEIDRKQHNITTIEDPVEYRLDGVTQIAVNSQAGVTFASILRSVLRQDPDVLLVGEIRDKETAEIACQAALTGHFVFSTLHANDTVATVTRMLDLGLDPMLIQTAVTAVLAQRLARRLCPKCREPYPPPNDLIKKVGLKPGVIKQIYKEKGCEECGNAGFKGRMGLHELMVMNDQIRELITDSPSIEELKRATRKAGTKSLQTDGLLKVLKGATSLTEVVRVTT